MGSDDRFSLFGDDEDAPDTSGAEGVEEGRGTDEPGRDSSPARPRRGVSAEAYDTGAAEDATPEDSASAVKASRRRRRAPRIFLAIIMALVLLVVGVLAYFLKNLSDGLGQIKREPLVVPNESTRPKAAADDAQTFVLMGSDSRGWDRGRSDSLMVAYLPADRKHLYLISFLRDMWVTIPANDVVTRPSKAKINAAYSWGGVPLTIQTLEQLTNVRMDHAAVIDFNGFTKLTTALGGVQVYNSQDSTIDGTHFPAGNITIEGADALKYVRERYDLKNGDLDRAHRQRDVLTAIIHKTLTAGVLTNPSKFNEVSTLVGSTMTVDDKLTNAEIRKLALSLRFSSGDGVVQVQAPISGFGRSKDGQAYDVVDEKGLQELSDAMRTDTMDQYVAAHPQ
ncbi:LCP family protein [Acidipropionibacterium timonense]|uniref:LCP family protein n=1 Tax=Acidipropionibacterium timonense TaxID=2161818 RepID=UPI001FD94800|nr:LCP family protein [Acidipropionibacterium timonense]